MRPGQPGPRSPVREQQQQRPPQSPPLSTRRCLSPEAPSTPNERPSMKGGQLKSRIRVCVCAASMQLGRERSRLVKVEQSVNQKIQRLAEREESVDALDAQVAGQELELCERRQDYRLEEAALAGNLEAYHRGAGEVAQREEAVRERELQAQQLRRNLLRQQQRVQKRLERVAANRQQLAEDRQDVAALKAELDEDTAALREAERNCASIESTLSERQQEMGRAAAEVGDLRARVRARQGDLEVIQSDLQTKEADLDERRVLLERTRAALTEREERLTRTSAEISDNVQRTAEAQRETQELERRLAQLWEDIHQRQQMLEDVDTSLFGREERLMNAQHSLVCAREAGAAAAGPGRWAGPETVDVEQLRLELMAAELSERAWRERSASLASREEELQARIQFLENAKAEATALPLVPEKAEKLRLAH
mmetsp:Transcript_48828/g.141428  ORF Transcript_48828/g.141428 Transcript_48828/m.141428 type:complete len:426 (+) Transcript_48828:93-1370(+)